MSVKNGGQVKRPCRRKLINLDRIRSNLRLITSTYGSVFNGHTSVDNMKDVKALSYDLSKLKDMDANIFDLELFNILSLSWDDAVTNGAIMKKLWERKKDCIRRCCTYHSIYRRKPPKCERAETICS